jgi:tetratricopeptide (TPR) repeat protein
MGLFPRARGATPSEEPVAATTTEQLDDAPLASALLPEPEPEVNLEVMRAEGKRRKKKKAGEFAGTDDVAKKAKNKGKEKVSRENMLLGRLEKQGDNYKNDGETLVELAALYADKHSWAQAIHYYKLALRALPESRDAIVPGLANAYFEYEMYEEAQFLYQDAVKKPAHVRMPKVWYHLGVIYERQLKWEISEYCLRHSLTLLPPLCRDVEIHCRLATCSNRLGNTADAIQSYKAACTAAAKPEVGAQPWLTEPMVWFELALQYDATNEPKLAQRCYGKSLMDATKSESWQKLGKRYVEVKEGTRAVSALKKAVELDGENPLLWWSLAEAYCCLNDKEKCVDGVRKVGIKLEKLVGDVKRREDDMRKRAYSCARAHPHARSHPHAGNDVWFCLGLCCLGRRGLKPTGIPLLCYAMLCYAMLCYAMLCYAMLCYAMLCYAMLVAGRRKTSCRGPGEGCGHIDAAGERWAVKSRGATRASARRARTGRQRFVRLGAEAKRVGG